MVNRSKKWLSVFPALASLALVPQTWADAPVVIGGVEYASVDPGPPFVEEPRPPQTWQAPEPTQRELEAGMLVFRADDPGEYYPDRTPKPDERLESLATALTPGETVSQWLGFQGLQELSGVSVTVAEVPGLEFEVRRIHSWPQRSTWFNSRTYQIVPELLLKQEGGRTEHPLTGGVLEWRSFDVPKGETVGLWINTQATADLSPGVHETTVTITSEGREAIEVPLTVEVYPFALPEQLEDTRWILYAWPNRYRSGADPRLDIREMVEYGIDGFLDNAYLMVSIEKGEDGELQIKDRANSIRWVERIIGVAQEEGMRGPFGLWTTPVNRELAKAYGVDMTQPWPEEMFAGVRTLKEYFDRQYSELGISNWMSFAADEPKPGNVYAIEAMKAWHAAGARTYCTAYTGTYAETAAWITDANIGYGDRQGREIADRHDAKHWIIGDGAYMGPHEMARHRRRAGLNFYLSDAYGCAIWRWGGTHGDPFNDFDGVDARPTEPADQLLAYPRMAEANNWKTYLGPIPTIAWESIRDGINDYKYLVVLERAIEQAMATGDDAAKERARDAAAAIERMREEFYRSAETEKGKNVFKVDSGGMMDLRAWAAREVVALQNGAMSEASAAEPAAEKRITVRVEPKLNVAAQNATQVAPPVLSVPRTPHAPNIDGAVGQQEWGAAATAAIPANVSTEARIMYDDENVYVAWVCDEPQLDRVLPADHESDTGPIWPQDSVELFIAPADARHQPAHLMINHLGRWIGQSTAVENWDARATVAARHTSSGYIVEMALPWEALQAIAPTPWRDVALNFCRVRNVDAQEDNRGKFNWAYGTGSFHQPERFGIGLLEDSEIQVLQTFCEPTEDGGFMVGAEVRNATSRPLVAKLLKLKGRNIELSHRSAGGNDAGRAIQPGRDGRVTRELPLRQRREQWVFHWKRGSGQETIETEFHAPSTQDLHALSLDTRHHVARAGDEVTVSPLLVSTQKGFLRVTAPGAEGVRLQLDGRPVGEASPTFTASVPEGVAKVVVELLNRSERPLVREEVSVIVLPK